MANKDTITTTSQHSKNLDYIKQSREQVESGVKETHSLHQHCSAESVLTPAGLTALIQVRFYDHSRTFYGRVEPWLSERTGAPLTDAVKVISEDGEVFYLGTDRVEILRTEPALPEGYGRYLCGPCATGFNPGPFTEKQGEFVKSEHPGFYQDERDWQQSLYRKTADGKFLKIAIPEYKGLSG